MNITSTTNLETPVRLNLDLQSKMFFTTRKEFPTDNIVAHKLLGVSNMLSKQRCSYNSIYTSTENVIIDWHNNVIPACHDLLTKKISQIMSKQEMT